MIIKMCIIYRSLKKVVHQWLLGFVPSTYKFREALGNTTSHPSRIDVILTWHPNLLVDVKPKAKSSKSYYYYFAAYNLLNIFLGRITWHVEQARLA